ncbi:MAG: HAMP domain-containing histidine kinase [Candidatus Eisenbacteria bacterium]|nr:HAMP domain-containing histidine kinase [Candidatus Eisenbacteria bacterium]
MAKTAEQKLSGSRLLRGYIFLGSSLLVALVFVFTNRMVHKLDEQANTLTGILGHFFAVASIPASENEDIAPIYREVLAKVNFPVVVTDLDGRPYAWAGIGIDVDAVSAEESAVMDPKNPSPGPLADIVEIVRRLDEQNPPLPLVPPGETRLVGYVHFGESGIVNEMRWMPIIELAAVFLFMGLGYAGFRSIKVGEQRYIWVGMAKETAHQLGTPISSMLGWLEVVKGKQREAPGNETVVQIERPLFDQFVDDMEDDVERLQKVACRFSSIGSMPKLQPQDVVPLVRGVVEYFRKRLPKLGQQLRMAEKYESVPFLNINAELMEWAVENVLRNAVDAVEGKSGEIGVEVRRNPDEETVELIFADDGRGMTPSEQKQAFVAGFTTKKRGWGLGLTLTQRIVEETHGGKIRIKSSEPGKGTVVVISFPV